MVHEFQNFQDCQSFEIREPQINLFSYLLLTLIRNSFLPWLVSAETIRGNKVQTISEQREILLFIETFV